MPRRKELYTCYLTPAQLEELRRISLETKVPVNVYIRQGVDLVLDYLRAEAKP